MSIFFLRWWDNDTLVRFLIVVKHRPSDNTSLVHFNSIPEVFHAIGSLKLGDIYLQGLIIYSSTVLLQVSN